MAEEITVRGYAEQRVPPDRARLRVTASGTGSDRQAAYGAAAGQARGVDEVVDARRAALGRVNHTALVVRPNMRWSDGEATQVGWTASRTTVIEVTDLEHLGDVVADLTAAASELAGPTWELDPANPVGATVRRAAAQDARARAEDYASALGLRLLGVAWVSEPGLRQGGGPMPPAAFAVAAAARVPLASAPEREVIELTPDALTVSAAVDVGFHVTSASG